MIRNIIIFSASGIVLYERAFNNGIAGVKPSMLGNLMVAMHTFSNQTTGMSVTFIELSNISVAMKWQNKIGCCLIYDCSDGKLLGQLICAEVLDAFIQDYTGAMNFVGLNNTTEYKGFSKRLANVIYYSIRPIMVYVEAMQGVRKALVVHEPHEVIDAQQDHSRDFEILADIPSLIELANELLMHGNDVLQSITIDCNENDRVLIWRIKEKFYLLCVVDPTVPQMSYTEGIEATLDMIEQIAMVHEELKVALNKS